MAEEAPVLDENKQVIGFSVKRRLRRVVTVTLFSLVGPVAIGVGALYVYATGGRNVSTENAYVKADKIAISADISGRVVRVCLLYTSPSPRDQRGSRMPSSA